MRAALYPPIGHYNGSSHGSSPMLPETMHRCIVVLLVVMLVTSVIRYAVRVRISRERHEESVRQRDLLAAPFLLRVRVVGPEGRVVPLARKTEGRHHPAPELELELEDGRRAALDPAAAITAFGGAPVRHGEGPDTFDVAAGTTLWLLASITDVQQHAHAAEGSPFRGGHAVTLLEPASVGAGAYRFARERDALVDPIDRPSIAFRGWIPAVVLAGLLSAACRVFDADGGTLCVALALVFGLLGEVVAFLAAFYSGAGGARVDRGGPR